MTPEAALHEALARLPSLATVASGPNAGAGELARTFLVNSILTTLRRHGYQIARAPGPAPILNTNRA